MAVGNAPLGEIVGRKLDRYAVARQDLDEVLAHLSRQVGENLVPLAEFDLERRIRQGLDNRSVDGDHVFFRDSDHLLSILMSANACFRAAPPDLEQPAAQLS